MGKLKRIVGFTLIEMMLVLVIISMIIYAFIRYTQVQALSTRIDRTTIQMQQILNASLAYYTFQGGTGGWPTSVAQLQTNGYLPNQTIVSPWGQPYLISRASLNSPLLYVSTSITAPTVNLSYAPAMARAISGQLPMGYTSNTAGNATTPPPSGTDCTSNQTCYVAAAVSIPGQNLNNATAVNFTGLYHHGGCVPVPDCPKDSNNNQVMTPQIMVVPTSVSGVNDEGSGANYPLVSFSAYASGAPAAPSSVPPCQGSTANSAGTPPCPTTEGVAQYWRVCLKVFTQKGRVTSGTTYPWGANVVLMAITRCALLNGPVGSNFNVYGN